MVCVNWGAGVLATLPGDVLMFILLFMCLSVDMSEEMD